MGSLKWDENVHLKDRENHFWEEDQLRGWFWRMINTRADLWRRINTRVDFEERSTWGLIFENQWKRRFDFWNGSKPFLKRKINAMVDFEKDWTKIWNFWWSWRRFCRKFSQFWKTLIGNFISLVDDVGIVPHPEKNRNLMAKKKILKCKYNFNNKRCPNMAKEIRIEHQRYEGNWHFIYKQNW